MKTYTLTIHRIPDPRSKKWFARAQHGRSFFKPLKGNFDQIIGYLLRRAWVGAADAVTLQPCRLDWVACRTEHWKHVNFDEIDEH